MKKNDNLTNLQKNLELNHGINTSDHKIKPINLLQEEGIKNLKSIKGKDKKVEDKFGAVSSLKSMLTSKETIERRGERKTANTLFQLASHQFNTHLDEIKQLKIVSQDKDISDTKLSLEDINKEYTQMNKKIELLENEIGDMQHAKEKFASTLKDKDSESKSLNEFNSIKNKIDQYTNETKSLKEFQEKVEKEILNKTYYKPFQTALHQFQTHLNETAQNRAALNTQLSLGDMNKEHTQINEKIKILNKCTIDMQNAENKFSTTNDEKINKHKFDDKINYIKQEIGKCTDIIEELKKYQSETKQKISESVSFASSSR